MKDNEVVSLQAMLEELLLNQMLTKRELARTIKLSIYKINQLLKIRDSHHLVKQEQIQKITKLYTRLKLFEDKLDEFLVEVRPRRKKNRDR